MDAQLQAALADILKLLTDGAQAVGTAAQTELPMLVQEILRYRFWEAVLWAVLMAIPMILMWYGVWRFYRIHRNKDTDGDLVPICGMLAAIGFFPGAFALYNIMEAVKITIAPRLYLLEQVKTLVSGH